jgi:uncharacterized protein YjiS (DUF1127 family)
MFPRSLTIFDSEREMRVMTDLPLRTLRRLQEWLDRWRPAHVELEDESDEELKDIGLEPLRRNFSAVKPFWMPWVEPSIGCKAPLGRRSSCENFVPLAIEAFRLGVTSIRTMSLYQSYLKSSVIIIRAAEKSPSRGLFNDDARTSPLERSLAHPRKLMTSDERITTM